MKKIVIVEDDAGIASSLKLYLENSDFLVDVHPTGKGAEDIIATLNPDVVILDINLPEKNWVDICRDLRENGDTRPIIMLTAKWGEKDRISWLDSWADDYVAKPFSPRELLARINSVLRRVQSEPHEEKPSELNYGNVVINTDTTQVYVNGAIVPLTKNEYDILETICLADWKLVSRESLMKDVIGYDNYVYDRTIDTHIKNLRKKLDSKDMILTIRGKWYRLNQ